MSNCHTPKQRSEAVLEHIRLNYRYRDGKLYDIYYANERGFSVDDNGYRRTCIRGISILVHHIIWFLCKGEWPKALLNHADGNKLNNRIDNLEESTSRDNQLHRYAVERKNGLPIGIHRSTRLPVGVYRSSRNRYCARFRVNGTRKYIGLFPTIQDAWIAYCAAYEREFGNLPSVNNYLPIKYIDI